MQGSMNFLFKDQIVNSLDFVGHMISIATTHLSHCNMKAAIDSM